MKSQRMVNQELELIANSERTTESNKHQFKKCLEFIWQVLVLWATKQPELRVWQSRDRFGDIVWHAYNPVTGKQVSRASEAELIDWIEHSYYR